LRFVAGLLVLFLATTGKQQTCQGEWENRGGHSVDFHNGNMMTHSGYLLRQIPPPGTRGIAGL
jgi:hypothetical protein